MRILLLGDASNYHRTLASGLRSLGQEVVVASWGGSWMQTERDIDITRSSRLPAKVAGLEYYLRMLRLTAPGGRLTGFDVVSIHNPVFLPLRPQRVREIFDRVSAQNGAVFLTALSTDTPYVEMCLDPDGPLRYSEYMHHGRPAPFYLQQPQNAREWLSPELSEHCQYIYSHIRGAVSALYEYHLALSRRLPAEKIAYGGIPVDLSLASPVDIPENPEKIRLFLGRHKGRLASKGTDRLEQAARIALDRHPGRGELVIIENRPFREYLSLLQSAHVVIDQAYSYTPATNALLAMANGQCAVSGAEPEYYDFIGEAANRPIFNSPLEVDAMADLFSSILTSPPGFLRDTGLSCRRFVEAHNAAPIVASRFLSFWRSHL